MTQRWSGGPQGEHTALDAATHAVGDRLVGDVMAHAVRQVHADTSFRDIAQALRTHHVNALPVVDDQRRVIGVVSSSDLLDRLAARHLDGGVRGRIRRMRRRHAVDAAGLMTAPGVLVHRDDPIPQAARIALRAGVHTLPVVDDGRRLVGVVSRGDLVGWYVRGDDDLAREVGLVLADFRADALRVQAEVFAGVVTLTGNVPTSVVAHRICGAVRAVRGVVDLDDDLQYEFDDRFVPGS